VLRRLLLSVALMTAFPAMATSVVALDIVEQAGESTAIVDAIVGHSIEVVDEDTGQGYTDTTLHIHSNVAGTAPEQIRIRQIKGERPDGTRFFVVGDAEVEEGERIVAFIRKYPDGFWYFTALNQSVWHVADRGRDPRVTRSFDGLEMYRRTERGVLPANESPQNFDTLSQLLSELHGLPCEGAR